jgi:hypothetical protein
MVMKKKRKRKLSPAVIMSSEVWTKDHADYLERLIARSRVTIEETEEHIVSSVQHRVLLALINLRRPYYQPSKRSRK